MKRAKLIAARERLHWTQQQAASKLGIGVNSLIRWEQGHVRPFGYNIQHLCDVYKATRAQLGLEDVWMDEIPVPTVPVEESTLQQRAEGDIMLRLLSLIWNWSRRNTHYQGLQVRILQITEGIESMENTTTQGSINRRDALQQLAMLPFALLGLGEVVPKLNHSAEEVLPVCAAAIVACWELSHSSDAQDIQLAFEGVTAYLPALKAIVQYDPSHRKPAAGLVGQSYVLKTILGWHKESLSKAAEYAQKALLYSKEADDLPLQMVAHRELSWLYYYMRQDKLALEAVERAVALLQRCKSPLPANLRGSVYSSFAVRLATQKQSQQALTHLRLAHEHYFSPSAPGDELTYVDSTPATFILVDGIAHLQLGLQKQALDSFGQIINADTLAAKMPMSARIRIEALNNQAMALLKSPQKDMEQTITVWTEAITEAKTLQSEQRFNEALRVYDLMETLWGGDKRVEALREYTQRW